ncbi:MAG: MauE/DoxX family redox-associated membrane protein [Opitutaceae bacterium]|jgi:uncharacterized membrane protein YphA (DoxX/SURF4 family)
MKWFTCTLRLVVAGVFLLAGVLKALDPASFARDIDHYRLLPYFAAAPLALYLPWLEITCGLAVLAGPARRSALVIIFGLTVVFMVAVASAWMRGLDIRCGCFGAVSAVPLWQALVRDIVLFGLILWLLRADGRLGSPSRNQE